MQAFQELTQLCDPEQKNLVPYWFQGPLPWLSKLPLLCKTHRRQLSRQTTVLAQTYKEKAEMEQGRTKKVEAAEEKEAAVGYKARAEPGSAGTQLSSIVSLSLPGA